MIVQSFYDVKVMVETHFKKEWNSMTRIMFKNTQQQIKPSDDKRFVRFNLINNDANQISIGQISDVIYTGLVNVSVFVPKGTGTQESIKLCDIALRIFDRQRLDVIQFRAGNITEIGEFDEHFMTNVTIPFFWHNTKA